MDAMGVSVENLNIEVIRMAQVPNTTTESASWVWRDIIVVLPSALPALTVMFYIRKFRVWLLSAISFKRITENQSLCYAFKKNEVH